MTVTQFNQQAAMQQMQMMERARLGGGPAVNTSSQTGRVQDTGIDPTNMSRGQLRNQWESALTGRPPGEAQQGGKDFQSTFGGSYIKDFNSDEARALLSQAASAIGSSGVPGSAQLAQTLAQGAADPKTVNKGAVQALQSFLNAQGCPVGDAGTDGKLGPDTYKALQKFMQKGGNGGNPQAGPTGGRVDGNPNRFVAGGMDRLNRMQTLNQPAGGNVTWA